MGNDANTVVAAILQISRAYLPERIVYMVGASGGVGMLLYLIATRANQQLDNAALLTIFGSGGLFASTAYGILRAFEKTLTTVSNLLSAPSQKDPNA
jgi:hypothetical protein